MIFGSAYTRHSLHFLYSYVPSDHGYEECFMSWMAGREDAITAGSKSKMAAVEKPKFQIYPEKYPSLSHFTL